MSYDGKINAYYKNTNETTWRTREISEIPNQAAFTFTTSSVDWLKDIGYSVPGMANNASNSHDTSFNIIKKIDNDRVLLTYTEYVDGNFGL